MRIAVIGLGKLGLPVALALEHAGHQVAGWDASALRREQIQRRSVPEATYEPQVAEYLHRSQLPGNLCRPADLEKDIPPEVYLVCVQTPHASGLDGETPIGDRATEDFDYSYLKTAVGAIADTDTHALVVIVSTCLPGTFEREIRPLTRTVEIGEAGGRDLRVAYHPLFSAMGSVIKDFRDPEFVLVGSDSECTSRNEVMDTIFALYDPLYGDHRVQGGSYGSPRYRFMSITSAELTKVAYNAAIGLKLMLANTVAELSERVGADADDVMSTLRLADRRIASDAYMTPGMGDGGACHPRDQIALSWLTERVGLSHDPFGYVVVAREQHAEWLAFEWGLAEISAQIGRGGHAVPMVMLGDAYKANLPLKTGSHARLVAHYARMTFDVTVTDVPLREYPVGCYFLGCPHEYFLQARLPAGSVLVDPWGVFAPISESEGITVIRPGRRSR